MLVPKHLIALTIGLFLIVQAKSQGIYLEANVGYGFPIASSTDMVFNSNSTFVEDFDNGNFSFNGTDEVVKLNLGKGFAFGGTFGYMFNANVGVELQLNYLVGGKTIGEDITKTTTISGGMSQMSTSTFRVTYSSTMLRAIPSFVVQGNFKSLNPYAKFGVLLGFGQTKLQQDANNSGVTEMLEARLNGGVSIGFNSRLGVMYTTESSITYFIEASIIAMNYMPTKGEITKYTVDGVDILGDLTTYDKEVEFVDTVTYSDQEDIDESKPSESLKMSLPFSSVGLNVGVRFNLGK